MKSYQYLQLFDENEKPILSSQGLFVLSGRIKTPEGAIKSLKRSKKAPEGAKFAAMRKRVLNASINITGLIEL